MEIALLFTLHAHPDARFLVALLDQLDRAGEEMYDGKMETRMDCGANE